MSNIKIFRMRAISIRSDHMILIDETVLTFQYGLLWVLIYVQLFPFIYPITS